jgi:hypothetical protein
MEMQPIDPNKPIAPEMSAQEWNAFLTAATSEHLVASPLLINKLMAQLRQQVTAQMSTEEMADRVP